MVPIFTFEKAEILDKEKKKKTWIFKKSCSLDCICIYKGLLFPA